MQPSSQPSNKRPLWQFLLPPMLIFSVGLHGLVLCTPVAPSEEDLVPAPAPEEAEEEAFDPGQSVQLFLEKPQNTYSTDASLPPPDQLRDADPPECFLTLGFEDIGGGLQLSVGIPVPNVKEISLIDNEPEDIVSVIEQAYADLNLILEPLDNYCGAAYYQLTQDGNQVLTLSLVTTTGGTLLVVWETPPQ